MATKDKEKISKKLEDINKLISPYKLAYVSISEECTFLKKNAHYMDKDIFTQLVENIKTDGFLSQLPFAIKQKDEKYHIISGNHRVRASEKAGEDLILILYAENVTKEQQTMWQLSHNKLVGKDDIQIIKEIYDSIENIDLKQRTGFSDIDFPEAEIKMLPSINEKDIELVEMKFLFTSAKSAEIENILNKLESSDIDLEKVRVVNLDIKDFIKSLTIFKNKKGIKSNSVAFLKLIETASKEAQDG